MVYDPFLGSGTTAKMALLNNRNFVGSEISKEYCDLAVSRLQSALRLQKLAKMSNQIEKIETTVKKLSRNICST